MMERHRRDRGVDLAEVRDHGAGPEPVEGNGPDCFLNDAVAD